MRHSVDSTILEKQKDISKKIKRYGKVVAWIIGIGLLLFITPFFLANWLQQRLLEMVKQQSDNVYELKLHGLEVSPFLGNVSVDSLCLNPNFKRWEQLKESGSDVPRTLLRLNSNATEIIGLNLFKAIFSKKASIRLLMIQNPALAFTMMEKDTTTQHQPPHNTVKGLLNGLSIDKIKVDNANLIYRSYPDTSNYKIESVGLSLTANSFQLDSQSFHDVSKAYYAKRMRLHAGKSSFLSPDKLYKLSADSISLDTKSSKIYLSKLAMVPQVKPAEMAKAKGKAVTYSKVNSDYVMLSGVNFSEHSLNNNYLIGHVLVQKPTLSAFKDKKNFKDSGIKPLPHEMVQQVKAKFKIDTINIKSGFIRYEELVPNASKNGVITFSNTNIVLTNLSNIPTHISDNNPAVINGNTLVMGKAPLRVTIHLPLLNKNGFHTMRGNLGKSDPAILNQILIPTAFIKIKRGQVREGSFDVRLTKHSASGKMTVLYDNLEIELLKKGSNGKQGLGKKLISEIADWVAIKDSNPKEGEGIRSGTITVTHDNSRSFITYWKDCLASGSLSSMGLEQLSKK